MASTFLFLFIIFILPWEHHLTFYSFSSISTSSFSPLSVLVSAGEISIGVFQSLELQQQKVSDLLEMCLQKDDIIAKLEAAMDATVEDATRNVYRRFN